MSDDKNPGLVAASERAEGADLLAKEAKGSPARKTKAKPDALAEIKREITEKSYLMLVAVIIGFILFCTCSLMYERMYHADIRSLILKNQDATNQRFALIEALVRGNIERACHEFEEREYDARRQTQPDPDYWMAEEAKARFELEYRQLMRLFYRKMTNDLPGTVFTMEVAIQFQERLARDLVGKGWVLRCPTGVSLERAGDCIVYANSN